MTGTFDHGSLAGAGTAPLTLSAAQGAAATPPATYRVAATHAGAMTSAQGEVSIAPVVVGSATAHIASPSEGAKLSGTVTVVASGTLPAGTTGTLRISIDGALLASDASLSFNRTWDTTSVTDGSHALAADTIGASGVALASATVHVTVSNTAPGSPSPPAVLPPHSGGCAAAGTDGAFAALALSLLLMRRNKAATTCATRLPAP